MKTYVLATAIALASTSVHSNPINGNRVSFYEIGLVCPAAPKIGCGSRSKPVLLSLAANPHIDGAWLNKAGTRLAIGWKRDPLSLDDLNQLLIGKGLAAQAVPSAEQAELRTSFRANNGWFDAASVDRLSEEEAGVIAARLVRRLSERVTVTPKQRTVLLEAIEQSCKTRFISGGGGELETELLKAAKEAHLDAKAVAALREVVALGYRPLPNEN